MSMLDVSQGSFRSKPCVFFKNKQVPIDAMQAALKKLIKQKQKELDRNPKTTNNDLRIHNNFLYVKGYDSDISAY